MAMFKSDVSYYQRVHRFKDISGDFAPAFSIQGSMVIRGSKGHRRCPFFSQLKSKAPTWLVARNGGWRMQKCRVEPIYGLYMIYDIYIYIYIIYIYMMNLWLIYGFYIWRWLISTYMIWLVVDLPLWKTGKSIGMMTFSIYGQIEHVPNHQPEDVRTV